MVDFRRENRPPGWGRRKLWGWETMIELSLGEVAAIVDGQLRRADPATLVTGSVEYDSRQVGPGGLFVAIAGEHADGHEFTTAAGRAGAVASLVTRPVDGP